MIQEEKQEEILGWTTIEQSNKLVDSGLDPNTADMSYEKESNRSEWKISCGKNIAIRDNLFSYRNKYVIPCWSLGKLIKIASINCERFEMAIRVDRNWNSFNNITDWNINQKTLIENIISVIIKMLNQGYIKKGEKQNDILPDHGRC